MGNIFNNIFKHYSVIHVQHIDKMDNEMSISLIIILMIGGMMVMTLLTCYACIFKDLCCQRDERAKRHGQTKRPNPPDGSMDTTKNLHDAIQLNDITQGESMPTESERI